MAVDAALKRKGLDYERVELQPGPHIEQMTEIYGEGNATVPGMLIDGEPVHGSRTIFARLEELEPDPPLFPEALADAVREAERWGDEELQDLGRRLPWGALHFHPHEMGNLGGDGPLDPAGTDFAIKFLRGTWRYHSISAERIAADLKGLPAKLDRVDELVGDGIIGGDEPNAADLQIGSTIRVLLAVGDVRQLIEGRPAEHLARRWFPDYPGEISRGAFPSGWIP